MTPMPMVPDSFIHVVLADDHRILREGVRALLENESSVPHGSHRLAVTGEAANGPDALALCQRLQPEVAVLDVSLPGASGLEVAQRLRQFSDPPAVVMLSMHGDPLNVRRAREAGASAYVVKGSGIIELASAIVRAAEGGLGPFPASSPSAS